MYYDNTNKWIAVTKINKSVSKETFGEVSKVAVKPSKVINWHSFMHYSGDMVTAHESYNRMITLQYLWASVQHHIAMYVRTCIKILT